MRTRKQAKLILLKPNPNKLAKIQLQTTRIKIHSEQLARLVVPGQSPEPCNTARNFTLCCSLFFCPVISVHCTSSSTSAHLAAADLQGAGSSSMSRCTSRQTSWKVSVGWSLALCLMLCSVAFVGMAVSWVWTAFHPKRRKNGYYMRRDLESFKRSNRTL